MEIREPETQITLEINVGKNFAELPDEAQMVLVMNTLKTLVSESLPRMVHKIKAPDTAYPFKIRVGVGLVDGNTVEGQNIMDDLNLDPEIRPK
jgi:hypothetical protein